MEGVGENYCGRNRGVTAVDKLCGKLKWAFSNGQPKQGGRLLKGGDSRQQKAHPWGYKSSYLNIKCDSFCGRRPVMPGCVHCVYMCV